MDQVDDAIAVSDETSLRRSGLRLVQTDLKSREETQGLSWMPLPEPVVCCSINQRRSAKQGTLIKVDIVNEIANITGITKAIADMALDAVFDSMKLALARGERVELRGFGIFTLHPAPAQDGHRPQPPHRGRSRNPSRYARFVFICHSRFGF